MTTRSTPASDQEIQTFGEEVITDNIEDLLAVLPPRIVAALMASNQTGDLIEIVLDLGRPPEARYHDEEIVLSDDEISRDDIAYVAERIGRFGDDNRAGIERTLHRISAIRSRTGEIVGLTCRIGRAVYGTIGIIRDLVESGESILLVGRPGVGKTTMLRETARVLADDLRKRVIVVDTSNEIAGDGDIPHPSIGRARRMQVPTPMQQHAVMIEAVENHMPEVIVIDEIGTELEAVAARTIAERGVQLIGTAHGNTLENLIVNPTLSDLIGGIQSVTLSDEEARRRGTQKSILERKAPPTFGVAVEIQARDTVAVHRDVAASVDAVLRGQPLRLEIRRREADGSVTITEEQPYSPEHSPAADRGDSSMPRRGSRAEPLPRGEASPAPAVSRATLDRPARIFPFGVSRNRLEQAIQQMAAPAVVVRDVHEADTVVTLKNYYRRRPQPLREAEARGVPIYVLRNNTIVQMANLLRSLFATTASARVDYENEDEDDERHDEVPEDLIAAAMFETETAIHQVLGGADMVALKPQVSWLRRLQHQLADRYNLPSRSRGREPSRYVEIFRRSDMA